jgi:hypothetical protein
MPSRLELWVEGPEWLRSKMDMISFLNFFWEDRNYPQPDPALGRAAKAALIFSIQCRTLPKFGLYG